MVRTILILTIVAAIVAAVLVSIAMYITWQRHDCYLPQDKLDFFLEVYKAIGIGFLVAVLGVLIPNSLAESRDAFERFKKSRMAYSEAKTSVLYLPEKLAGLEFDAAVEEVRKAHEKLHLCETYPKELREHLRWHAHPKTWVDRNYWELYAVRKTLDKNVFLWSHMSREERLKIITRVLENVGKDFDGEDGIYLDNEKWWEMGKLISKEGKKEERKKNIKKAIDRYIEGENEKQL